MGLNKRARRTRSSEAGQAITEYVLMLSIIATLFMTVLRPLMSKLDLSNRLVASLNKGYSKTYQYGDPRVRGPDDEQGPDRHPRFQNGNNFRIFINPRQVQ